MSRSIIPQLVKKDLRLVRVPVLLYWLGGLLAVVVTAAFDLFHLGTILFISCLAGAGMHPAVQTAVEERREKALPFIMSLPITVREYTLAKLVANLVAFGAVWLTLCGASLIIFAEPDGMNAGALPFIIIVLVGIFLACIVVLAASLLTGTIGGAVGAIVGSNIVTQLFLWWVVGLEGIREFVRGDVAVWSTTALTVLGGQLAAIALLVGATYALQARKTDFI